MARKTIPLVTGEKYHVYNRGVDKRNIFDKKADFLRFYRTLECFNCIDVAIEFDRAVNRKHKQEEKLVQVHAYCLLSNHYHLILEQLVDGGLSEFMKRLSVGYTGYFNEQSNRSGVLFQGGYKRVLIESTEQYNYLFAYVNENYTVHGIREPEDVFSSSSKHYRRLMTSKLLPSKFVNYNHTENMKLALQIHKQRESFKKELLEM